jgi:hypothetical protein
MSLAGARSLRAAAAGTLAALVLGCATHRPARTGFAALSPDAVLELAGHFSITPDTVFPAGTGPRFGGISGLAPTGRPGEYYAVSDDRLSHRLYRMRVTGEGSNFRVEPVEMIPLDAGERGPRLDPEAIIVTKNGDLLISSEGRGRQLPHVPPAIAQYSPNGAFIRRLDIRDRYLPDRDLPDGSERTRGVRDNAGFESLALSPSGQRLYTATETALLQDGDTVTFDHGTVARLLEFVPNGNTFVPRREFAYPLDALGIAPFTPGVNVAGIVELLALSDDELLALERSFIEVAGQRQGINYIRLFHVSVAGSDDISAIDSLRSATAVRAVQKRLVLDLSALPGLPPELTTLDNFEGLASGPTLADGSRSLLIVSDDNFNKTQRTWFLLLRISDR